MKVLFLDNFNMYENRAQFPLHSIAKVPSRKGQRLAPFHCLRMTEKHMVWGGLRNIEQSSLFFPLFLLNPPDDPKQHKANVCFFLLIHWPLFLTLDWEDKWDSFDGKPNPVVRNTRAAFSLTSLIRWNQPGGKLLPGILTQWIRVGTFCTSALI